MSLFFQRTRSSAVGLVSCGVLLNWDISHVHPFSCACSLDSNALSAFIVFWLTLTNPDSETSMLVYCSSPRCCFVFHYHMFVLVPFTLPCLHCKYILCISLSWDKYISIFFMSTVSKKEMSYQD